MQKHSYLIYNVNFRACAKKSKIVDSDSDSEPKLTSREKDSDESDKSESSDKEEPEEDK